MEYLDLDFNVEFMEDTQIPPDIDLQVYNTNAIMPS